MSDKSDQKPAEAPSPIGEISQEPSALETFLDANQKKLVLIGILAILILVGYVIYEGIREIGIKNDSADVSGANTVPEYEEVIQNLKDGNAKGSAILLKSQLLWEDQQQQEALTALKEFISSFPDHPAIGSAHAKLGSYQQQLGNLDEAKAAFQEAAETKSAASSLALLSLGDIARQAGKNDEAKALYDRIIAEYEESHFQVKSLARDRIELIGVEGPTEKAPAPPKTPTEPSAVSPAVRLPKVLPEKIIKPAPDPPASTPTPVETPTREGGPETTPAPEDAPAEEPAPEETPTTGEETEIKAEEATGSPTETPAPE